MAKSGNSKVIFVPMQLQSDVVGQLGGPSGSNGVAAISQESGEGVGTAGRAGILNSVSEM